MCDDTLDLARAVGVMEESPGWTYYLSGVLFAAAFALSLWVVA